MDIQEETFAERRTRLDHELRLDLDRAMRPIMFPLVIAAGALAGLLGALLFLPPLPTSFIGVFISAALIFGFAPLGYMIIKYR